MNSDLLVIVPSRGRPESLERVAAAWDATKAFGESAGLVFAVDDDDPSLPGYHTALARLAAADPGRGINLMNAGRWRPMVAKLDRAANLFACQGHFALAFMGDDHRPRTVGWASTMLAALREMGTGIVYGDDLLQRERLCTAWAMTSDIVQTLGAMVPAPVEHMYCDNAVMDLGRLAGCLRYLPEVVIEHCHPLAGKADWDGGYARVNRADQYRRDEALYRHWCDGMRDVHVAAVKALRSSDGSVRDSN
jgi:hypothetical protein